MENLYINDNPDEVYYPIINFNCKTGVCEISGESYMEETYKFYQPVLKWLEEFSKSKNPIEFNIKLSYFNTSSSRSLLDILMILKKFKDNEGQLSINWYYLSQDPDMLGEISGFEEETGLNIKPIAF
jgi:hypothetical protein